MNAPLSFSQSEMRRRELLLSRDAVESEGLNECAVEHFAERNA